MPKFFVEKKQIYDGKAHILGDDINHIKNVLRLKKDDTLDICSIEEKKTFKCKIEEINNDIITCNILEELKNEVESNVHVTIFQGLPKADKMELIIQKSVELGVNALTPIEMKRCVVKLNEKDKAKKIQRWQKISEVAAKQCGRNIIPKINNIIKINEICDVIKDFDVVIVAYENEKENYLRNEIEKLKKLGKEELRIAICIGPEGGFEEREIAMLKENGAKIITLGNRILRTETVALNMLSILMYELENVM